MKILKIFLLIGLFTGASTIICLPSTICRFYFPYIVLIAFAIVVFSIPYVRKAKYWRNILIGSIILTACLLLPGISFLRMAEGGFDDGPFYPEKFKGDPTKFTPNESVKYRKGYIKVVNRNTHEPPIIYFEQSNGKIEWAVSLDVSKDDDFKDARVSKIENLKVGYGPFRDKLKFTANWTYGAERGYAYLWKWNSFQRYYLSW